METARNEALPEGVETTPDVAADKSARSDEQSNQTQQAQAAQAAPPAAPPDPESGRAAAAASAQPEADAERGSVLRQFLADGPPQLEEGRDEAPADPRPVELGQEDAESGPAGPGAGEAPLETAADDAPVGGGGVSAYRDFGSQDFGDLAPELTPTTLPSAPIQNVAVPPTAPPPAEPESEQDPLTSRRLAAGEDLDGGGAPPPDDDDDDQTIIGTAGDDTLSGGAGDDTLTGDDGADVFAFSASDDGGDDVVTDFDTGSDILRLSDVTDTDSNGADLGDLDAGAGNSVTGDAAGVNIGLAGGTTITLAGVDGTGLDSFADLSGSGVNVDVA